MKKRGQQPGLHCSIRYSCHSLGLDPNEISLGQLRDWLRRFRLEHPQEWALYLTPDRAKGSVSPAFGSRSQSVFYPNHVWELDSMRVDIHCKTEVAGTVQLTRAFVIACVDVFTRRVMLYVTYHSDAEAVCLLIAAAILKWGVPDHIRTNHGKEYLSRRVQRFPFELTSGNRRLTVFTWTSRTKAVCGTLQSHLSASRSG